MSMKSRRLFCLAATLVLLPALEAAPGYELYYFDEPQTLMLDPTRIAVFQDVAQRADAGAFTAALSAINNIDAKRTSPHALAGWSLAPVGVAARSPIAIEQLVDVAAQDARLSFVSPVFFDRLGGPFIVTRDILVGFEKGIDEEAQMRILAKVDVGAILVRNYANMPGVYKIRATSRNGFDVLEATAALARRGDVRFAEPDMIFTGRGSGYFPNDTGFSNCWHHYNTGQSGGTIDMDMDTTEAWTVTKGDPSVMTLIIDTGVDQTHPDLNQLAGMDFTNTPGVNGGPNNQCDNHGTAVAGCVSATIDNNLGTVGTAPLSRSVSARCFVSTVPCNGGWNASYSWTADALAWAETLGVRVSNNSNSYGGTSATVTTKYLQTRTNGMVHFASAGNNNANGSLWPASLPTVNSVAALDRNGNKASFSNFGADIAFSAPGVSIYSTDRQGSAGYTGSDYTNVNGTSFASPNTAGVAALILSANPGYSAAEVETALRDGAVDLGAPGWDQIYGWGFVNAAGALNVVVVPDPPTPFALTTPADTATGIDTSINVGLQWNASDPGVGYTITISTSPALTSPIFSALTANTFAVVGGGVLLKGTTYYWGVVAENIDTLTTNSTPYPASFATAGCVGDIDGDGFVTINDLNIVLFNFGTAGPSGDVNQDGSVNLADLNLVLFEFGAACP